MHYEAYLGFKAGPESRVAEKAALQRRLAKAADQTFAVGPLLAERMRPTCSDVRILIPGLELATPTSSDTILSLTTFGRFDAADLVIKQAPLVAAAFGRARRSNPHERALRTADLQVIGLHPEDKTFSAALKADADEAAGRLVNTIPLPFTEDATELRERLRRSNLVVAASLHEGFGLTAWEAIGAGAPVIVSENSGVHRYIDETLEGRAKGCLHTVDVQGRREEPYYREEDAEALSEAIRAVAADIPRAKRNALSLRTMLLEAGGASWETAAAKLLQSFEAPRMPASPVQANFGSRATQTNAVADCVELSISTTQGSGADRCDILAELRFGQIEMGGLQSRYLVGIREAKLALTLRGCTVIPGRRAGDSASDDANVVSAPGPAWRIVGPREDGCLTRRVLGDEPLCAVKLDGAEGEAKLELSCRSRDLVISRVTGSRHADRSVNRNRVIKAFLAKCLRLDEDNGVISTAILAMGDRT